MAPWLRTRRSASCLVYRLASVGGPKAQGWKGEDVGVRLVCGADLLESFEKPGVWIPDMVRELLMTFGVICVAREGTNVEAVLDTEVGTHEKDTHRFSQFYQNEGDKHLNLLVSGLSGWSLYADGRAPSSMNAGTGLKWCTSHSRMS